MSNEVPGASGSTILYHVDLLMAFGVRFGKSIRKRPTWLVVKYQGAAEKPR